MNMLSRLPRKLLLAAAVAAVLLVAAGGALAYWFVLRPQPKGDANEGAGERLGRLPSFGQLHSGRPQDVVAAVGRLTPRGDVIEIGGLMGDRLGRLIVDEGDQVCRGQLLGYLDSYKERLAEKEAIEAQLVEAQDRLKAEREYSKAQIVDANVGVQQAQELDPLDVAAQRAKVRALDEGLKSARQNLTRLQSAGAGAVTGPKLDEAQQLVNRLEGELEAGQATLDKAIRGQTLNLAHAKAQLELADAGLKRVEASSPVRSLEQSLVMAETRLERTRIRAPRDGVILKILARPLEKLDQKPILRMGDTSVMYAVTEVYETDILLVKPGQKAKVTSRALHEPLTGTVERIGQMIYKNDVLHVDPAAAADARVVEVWVRLDKSDVASRLTNLQVDVAITVKE